ASLPRGLDTDHGKNQSRDTQPADQAEGSGQPSTPPQADQTARVICSRDSAAHNKQCAKKMMYLHDMSLRFLLRRYGKPSG
ncbi:hypothetical protein E2128_17100, partial [Escherichia coli]